MKKRTSLQYVLTGVLAACLTQAALAKPPERDFERAEERAEEAAERAEEAAERAERAAERAQRSAERAAERAERDRFEDRSDRSGSGGGDRVDDIATTASDSIEIEDFAETSGEQSNSGSGSYDDDNFDDIEDEIEDALEDLEDALDDLEDNSGPGSFDEDFDDDDDDDDNSGPGSSGDDDDDDDDDKDDDDQQDGNERLEFDDAGYPYRADEFVVLSSDPELIDRAGALGFSLVDVEPLSELGEIVATLRKPRGMSSSRALELLRSEEPDSPAGYNYLYRPSGAGLSLAAPVGPFLSGAAQPIGVIDGFRAEAIAGWPVERLVDTSAQAGHGDDVTAILLDDLASAYGTRPADLKLFDVVAQAPGGPAADVAALVLGLDRALSSDVRVINLSLAGPAHPALQSAISGAQSKGATIVAAVGNGGPAAAPTYPAAYDGVVGVAAVDAQGRPYLYSVRGPLVDVAALGVNHPVPGRSETLSGTSYAAPHVTAFLAFGLGLETEADAEQLIAGRVLDAGAPGRDQVFGLGILQPAPTGLVRVSSEENEAPQE